MFAAVAVVIDVAPEAAQSLAEAAVESCDAALGAGRCRIAEPTSEASGLATEWYAIVRWEGERLEIARIDFHQRDASGPLLRSRQIVFSSRDDARDRWASVGVLVAALVASQEEDNEASNEPSRAPEPMRDVPAYPEEAGQGRAEASPRWRLDLAATLARSLERGTLQPGGVIRPSLELGQLPVFFSGSISYAWRPGTAPSVSWLSEGLGFGVRIGTQGAAVAAELRTELIAEQWLIEAEEAERSESEWVARFGARMGLDTLWRLTPKVWLLVGAQGSVLRPEIAVEVGAQPVERVPAYGLSALAGIRFVP
jgi:hypothetical protein